MRRTILRLCTLSLIPAAVLAQDPVAKLPKDYYFATLKFGIDQPITSGGNGNVDHSDSTFIAGVELGKKFKELFSVSLEYKKIGNSNFTVTNDISNKILNATSSSWSGKSDLFFVNFGMDVIKNSLITPYLKFGVGTAVNRSSSYVVNVSKNEKGPVDGQLVYPSKTSNHFAWQVGTGANVTINELFDLDFAYMYINRGQMSSRIGFAGTYVQDPGSPARTTNLRDHSLTLGFKAKF